MDADTWNEESRCALDDMSEMERFQACDHRGRGRKGMCPDCGDSIDWSEA